MKKRFINIALWIVVCLIALCLSYAASLIHWIAGAIMVLIFIAYGLLKYDNLKDG